MPISSQITVKPEQFRAAVGWAAKWIAGKPVVPVHAGLSLTVLGQQLRIGAFSENVTAHAVVDAGVISADGPHTAIVSGRLLDALVGACDAKKPITLSGNDDGTEITLTSGRFVATMPAMSEDDYPALPGALPAVATVSGAAFAEAVARVGVASGKEDAKAGVARAMRLGLNPDGTLELIASDSIRVATCSVRAVVIDADAIGGGIGATPLGATLIGAAASFDGPDDIEIGYDGNVLSLTSPTRSMTVRLLKVEYPLEVFRGFFGIEQAETMTIEPAELAGPLKRASIVRGKDGPVRVTVSAGTLAIAAAEAETRNGSAEPIDVDYAGDGIEMGFNPDFFADALHSAPGPKVTVGFTAPRKPITVTCADDPTWRHILVPVVINR